MNFAHIIYIKPTGRQTVDSTLLTTSSVLALAIRPMDYGEKAGHWMGEADFQGRPFKPKVLAFKLLQSKLISENGYTSYFPLWTGLRVAFPCFIPMHIGNNAGTDML
jgi:hypothetical protein